MEAVQRRGGGGDPGRQRVRLESYSHFMSRYFAFVALVAVLVLIPGPAVILVMQKAVTTGYRGALRVAAGVLAADLVWAAAAAAGVSAVIVASGLPSWRCGSRAPRTLSTSVRACCSRRGTSCCQPCPPGMRTRPRPGPDVREASVGGSSAT